MSEVVTPDALRAFLEGLYAPSAFHVTGGEWAGGGTHAEMLVDAHARRLRRYGASSVGRFVSASGASVWFDAQLRILPGNPLQSVRRIAPPAASKARGASSRSRRR